MKKYYITYKQHGKTEKSTPTTKKNALTKYLITLGLQNPFLSELKIHKQFKNGKIVDITASVNKFLRG